MTDDSVVPEFWECQNCGNNVRWQPHLAFKNFQLDSLTLTWGKESMWLCCGCFESVGGKCNGH